MKLFAIPALVALTAFAACQDPTSEPVPNNNGAGCASSQGGSGSSTGGGPVSSSSVQQNSSASNASSVMDSSSVPASSSQASSSAVPSSSSLPASSSTGAGSSGAAPLSYACPYNEAALPPLAVAAANNTSVLEGDPVGLNRVELGCVRRVVATEMVNAEGRFETGPLWLMAGTISSSYAFQEFRNIGTETVCRIVPTVAFRDFDDAGVTSTSGLVRGGVGTSPSRTQFGCLAPGESGVLVLLMDGRFYFDVARAIITLPAGEVRTAEPVSRVVAESYQFSAPNRSLSITFRNTGPQTGHLLGAVVIFLDDNSRPLGGSTFATDQFLAPNAEATHTGLLLFNGTSRRFLVMTDFEDTP